MNWTIWAPIIAQHGVEFAYSLWARAESGLAPTEADWTDLRGKARSWDTIMAAARARAGVPPTPAPAVKP